MRQGDLTGARCVRQETESSIPKKKPGSAARETGERLLDIMDAALAGEAGDWETFRRLHVHMSLGNTTELQRVNAAFQLAKADLAQGEQENARAHLGYVMEHGGTLYLKEKAHHLLAELEQT